MSCKHPSLFQGMCVVCGMKVAQTAQSASKVEGLAGSTGWKTSLNVSGGKVLQLSAEEAASVSASKLTNLRNSKKLALVLDLDHTLLHAIQIEGQTPSRTAATARVIEGTSGMGSGDGSDDNLVHHLPIEEIDRLTVKHLVMKKRPFLDEFLERASEFCQMTVYTAGTRRYAEAVARVIDPTRRYFGDRIVSRCDVANIRADGNDKSLERIYPGDASMAVIMDDREDVWRGPQSAQLLLVRPFVHFDPRPNEAAAAAAAAAGTPIAIGDNAASPLPDALGTLSRGAAVGGNGKLPEIASPIITLCAAASGEPAGRISKVAPLYSFEHSSGDDQLRRCLQVLTQIHAQYYAAVGAGDGEGDGKGSVESKEAGNSSSNGGDTANNTSSSASSSSSSSSSSGEDSVNTKLQQAAKVAAAAKGSVPRSVAGILQGLKKTVLAGCTLTFSGLIPTNEENPRNHTLWRLAESLGAQVSQEVLPRTTHLISLHTQTQKVAAVLQRRAGQVWVLHPDWLIYCRWSLSRANEATFMLNQLPPGQPLPCPVMDYSPLPPPSAPVAINSSITVTEVAGPPAAASSAVGANSVTALTTKNAGTDVPNGSAGGADRKRPRSGSGGSSSSEAAGGARMSAVEAADSMMGALKKLRAVGPTASSSSNGARDTFLVRPAVPAPSLLMGVANGAAGAKRGPSPTHSSSDASRRSALFPSAAAAGTAPSATSSSIPSTSSSTNSAAQPPQMGVIKKKVGALLLLERDSSGEGPSTGGVPRPSAVTAKSFAATTSSSATTDSRGAWPAEGAKTSRYSPGHVRLAGPGDIDRSFRLEPAGGAGGGSEGLYFCEEREDGEEVEEVEDGVGNGGDSESSGDSAGRSNTKARTGAKASVRARARAASIDSTGTGTGSGYSSASSGGGNSLLGEGDGDFALYGEDEGDQGNGEGDQGNESGADEGMLCCNDDQGSTCSATAPENGEGWGSGHRRRRREQRAAADPAGVSSEEIQPSTTLLSLQRQFSSSSSLRSGGGGGSSAAASSSDDDEGSDFEVMMLRRRRLGDQQGVGMGQVGLAIEGPGLGNPIMIDDDDAFSDE